MPQFLNSSEVQYRTQNTVLIKKCPTKKHKGFLDLLSLNQSGVSAE